MAEGRLHSIPTIRVGIHRHAAAQAAAVEEIPLSQRTSFHGSGAIAFSTKGEYGVRLMVQLGRRLGKGPASLAEIAAAESLPRAYLEQLVMSLRDAELVVSTRGAHGGYELSRPSDQIRMSDVLHALEGPIAPMICASDDPDHAFRLRSKRTVHREPDVASRPGLRFPAPSTGMTLADLVPARLVNIDPATQRRPEVAIQPPSPPPQTINLPSREP